MYLLRRVVLLLILLNLLSSCAIHNKFPFICFRSGCVKVAFGIYQIKAWKKNRQGKAQVRKNKANAKASLKSKKDKLNGGNSPNYSTSDTTTYSKGIPAVCNQLKLVFFKSTKRKNQKTDTLIIGFTDFENEINALDKVQIDGYLQKHTRDDIIKVKLCDCDKNTLQSDVSRAVYLKRSSKTTYYLKTHKIPKRKVELE